MLAYSIFKDTFITPETLGDQERKVGILFERQTATYAVLKRFSGFR
tara:strand:- start:282 stop:419 length:138 start_codon:yes stop_codon:yes gene_type:complete